MIDRAEYLRLLKKYLDNSLLESEHDRLFSLTASEGADAILLDRMEDELNEENNTGADLPPHCAEEIMRNILVSAKNSEQVLDIKPSNWKPWLIAAAFFAILLTGTFFIFRPGHVNRSFIAGIYPRTNIEKINSSRRPLFIALEDGSKVTLQPGGILNYPAHFDLKKREVYLQGEAFFTVAKNSHKPFLVYYGNVVTQVLGTSFNIKTNPKTYNPEVSVLTGKVQVYENSRLLPIQDPVKGVIVTRNQKAIYDGKQRTFETTLTDSLQPLFPDPIADSITHISTTKNLFHYTSPTSLKSIFKQCEDVFGVEIFVENEDLNACLFTGDLGQKDLFKKLEIICLTVDAQFEIRGTRILVSGKGCN